VRGDGASDSFQLVPFDVTVPGDPHGG
jgi:hypothetical protein